MAELFLKAVGVGYSYPGRGRAVRGVDASIAAGLTLLVGANAGGKSTLLRLLSGLVRPDAGFFASADGKRLTGDDLWKMSRLVIQDADPQILGATVAEDVNLGREASNLGAAFGEETERLLARFGMTEQWTSPIDLLSFGQKRKLNLINAMLAGPELLLLDEPFEGLDYPAARELRNFVAENRRAGVAQVISTHDLEPVFDLADHIVVMSGGTSAAEGDPAAILPLLPGLSVRPPGGGWGDRKNTG